MRDIRFRAWDIKNKWMMCPITSIFEFGMDGFKGIVDRAGQVAEYKQPLHVELMQFTGLYDKDKTPIYEGDICENGDWESDAHAYNLRVEEVYWDYDSACWQGWNHNTDGMCCKVIGNIWESKHLLEAKP